MFNCSFCNYYNSLEFPNIKQCKKCDNGSNYKIKISEIRILYHTRKETLELNFKNDNTEEALFEAFETFDLYNKKLKIYISLEFEKYFIKVIDIIN